MGQQFSHMYPRHGENQPLLPEDAEEVVQEIDHDHDGCFPRHGPHDVCPANPYADLPVYTTIHRIRRDIIQAIDDPYSIEQLRDPRMNMSVVRPLVDTLYELDDVSIIYCLLVNRAQFMREQLTQPHQQSVRTTRALLCELIANRILRRFHEDNPGSQGLLLLAQILVGGFDPFQGAPEEVLEEQSNMPWTSKRRTGNKRKLPALEIAIITESKTFLSWHVYTQNLWSFLDVTFSTIFGIYLVLRIHGLRKGELEPAQQAMDVLAMGAPVLVPRLAFNLMSENMLFISLREMMRDFTVLTILAVWCFAGFLLSMVWLSNGAHEPITISKWMLWVWFGLDGTGIQRSVDFHWLLGPILMVAFAFLGNTLFLTILVSMLSTTFSTIVTNATAEIQFRRAVLTLEGVKSDAIFAYQPPLNILALLILLPLKQLLTPRWFHKINVAAVRTFNAPLLLIIGFIERRILWSGIRRQKDVEQLPKPHTKPGFWDFSRGFRVHGDIQAVFDAEPPQEIEDEIEEADDLGGHTLQLAYEQEFGAPPNVAEGDKGKDGAEDPRPGLKRASTSKSMKNRRDSVMPFVGMSQRMRDLLNEGSEDEDAKYITNYDILMSRDRINSNWAEWNRSQATSLVTYSSQASDQAHWDRSWRTVTQVLTLPTVANDADLLKSTKLSPSLDRTFDEALQNIFNHESRVPQAKQAPDIILWYTNHVRHHYLNQVFPIIQKLRNPASTHSANLDAWVRSCIQILECAHKLYYAGLYILIKPMRDAVGIGNNFRLNLSTVVSNSIPDREAVKRVVKKHVSAILEGAEVEDGFLGLVKSLVRVGLGGEKFQIIFAEIMNDAMRDHVYQKCGRVWDEPVPDRVSMILPRAVHHTSPSKSTIALCEWIEERYAKLAVQVFEIVDNSHDVNVSWTQVEKWKEMSLGHLAQWPKSSGGLSDLRTAITTPQRRLHLTDVFTTRLKDRLLHPGASTLQILQTYISMIRSFHVLDQSDVLLSRVAFPLQLYLCSRDDTVRIIITGLLSEIVDVHGQAIKPGGDKLVELALLLDESSTVGRADDEELDWHDLDWVPDPVDAGPGYKRSKSADIIGTLIRVLGSQDVFIKEFQNIIGENLLKNDGAFEKEIKVLDLLKARFGEAPLQSCEVMLKDIQDSGRVNATIRHNQELDVSDEAGAPESTSLNAKILSRLFWPQLHDESYQIPQEITDLQNRYEQGFESLKSSRKLTWLPALGQATVELELTDRTIVEEVLTWQATVIWAFESDEPGDVKLSVSQLVKSLEMSETIVRSALKFWSNKLVLQEGSKDVYTVLESLNQEERARSNAQAAGSSRNTGETPMPAQHEGTAEKMQMYWPFIQAMLTNSSSQMPLQQMAMMLKVLIAEGFPHSNEELQEFLGEKVTGGELEVVGGKYRLKK
ncbi:Anaphase-promoting complex subunit 2 [Hyphodiscus hymeniophilus]|uniref:Anaphase-promoting complex subunit 2 n=1 Tax=Hyphodiscus hymeniophilus TaxID=353542 RepID=A0A9P6VN07_9HELO|nr:Anaphase-promoting complex subunit 2 [Hyphodiscus hymeniophilus]